MSITDSIRIATLAAASLIGGATIASSQACPPSPSYTPDFSANQSCLTLNPVAGTPPSFAGPQTSQTSVSTVLRLTPAVGGLATSAWYNTPLTVTSGFSTTFAFQLGNSSVVPRSDGDGFAFVIQNTPPSTPAALNSGLNAVGPGGCGIGFGDTSSGCASSTGGIPNSVAIEFNTFNNGSPVDPNSANDVAIQSCPGGAANSVDYTSNCNLGLSILPAGINLTDGTVHVATVNYAATGLSNCGAGANQICYTLDVIVDGTDLFSGGVPFDMTSITSGGATAYVGFTAATGGANDEQDIVNWIFAPTVTVTNPIVPQTPATFNINGGFILGSNNTGYDFTANETDTTLTPQMTVSTIPVSQQACNALVEKTPAFSTAQCFVYQNGGGQGQDAAVLFEVTCNGAGSCGQVGAGTLFDADLGTDFSFKCNPIENLSLFCGTPPNQPFSFGLPNLTSVNGLPSVGFLKGDGPDPSHPCTPNTDGTPLFASNQIESFALGDTSGGAKGGSGGTTSCWVMTDLTQIETPSVSISQPGNSTYTQGQSVNALYSCTAVGAPAGSAVGPYLTVATCTATDSLNPNKNFPSGSPFDTTTLGVHTFTSYVKDSATNTSSSQPVTYTVVAAPVISGPSSAIFTDGTPASVTFSASGYPASTFSKSGNLPTGVSFVPTPNGATISGTATTNGVFPITISASNGVGSPATLAFTLTTAATTPAAGKCNGVYDGTFKGNLTVSSGQTCTFVGGGVTGNITENGGKLVLTGAAVGGNIQVNSGSFSIGPGVTIKGGLSIVEPPKSTVQSLVCGATIGGNLQVLESSTPVAIGSNTAACAGNTIAGNLNVSGNNAAIAIYNNTVDGSLLDLANAKPTQVFSNHVKGLLSCLADSGITGGSNTALLKLGQCSKF
jgi:hypothetical protein